MAPTASTHPPTDTDTDTDTDTVSETFHADQKTFAIGSQPAGVVGSAIVRVGNLASQARSTANQRLKTASTIKAANDAARLSQLSPKAIDATATTNAAVNGGPGDPSQGAFGVSVTLGGSKSSQDSHQVTTTQRGSTITGQTVEVRSREGNVEVVGAQITGHDVDLHAAKKLVLSDSKNTTNYDSHNKADSASVGVTIGLGEQNGISFQAGANTARGNGSGHETTGNNAVVHATGHLSYSSGGDTVLNGARLEGESVTGRTGGKLIITSPQDTGTFTSQPAKQATASACIPADLRVKARYPGLIPDERAKREPGLDACNSAQGCTKKSMRSITKCW